MHVLRKWFVAALALGALSMVGACAQDVGDIDRTQPDLVKKSDLLEGEWYVRQTVADVPATSRTWFEGFTFGTEKVVWQVTSDELIAYRSYELNPGAETDVDIRDNNVFSNSQTTANPTDDEIYYGEPILRFPVSHVDIQRQYSSSTLEETNVISENTSDRPWYEREYIRVDWGASNQNGYDFWGIGGLPTSGTANYVSEGANPELATRFEYDDDGALQYFDVNHRLYLTPDIFSCIYLRYGIGIGECQGHEMGLAMSVMRVDDDSYEPLIYDDRDMARYGYFRTERYTRPQLRHDGHRPDRPGEPPRHLGRLLAP